mmetsp:Transcript_30612/g.46975  ORF Transcript_30612/g.46975 Transcript_30612/m.46975 type:complete len:258 (+) Transcript_30612:3071-3844(+)
MADMGASLSGRDRTHSGNDMSVNLQNSAEGGAKNNSGINLTASKDDSATAHLHLIEELQACLTFLKGGVLYRNKRVFTKIKQMKTKRSASNNSNSSHSMPHTTSDRRKGKAFGTPSGPPKVSSMIPSPILSKKSQRYEDIEAAYDYIVEQEELKRLKQKKILAKRRKQKKKQMLSSLHPDPDHQSYSGSSDRDSSDDFTDDDLDDDYFDDFDDSRNINPNELGMEGIPGGLDFDSSCIINDKGDSSRILDYSQFPHY